MEFVHTKKAPEAIGPYSQAVVSGGLIFASGQVALDPETMTIVGENVTQQTHRALTNLAAVLEQAGGGLDTVLKTTVYLADMAAFAEMNAEYSRHFGDHKPARAAIAVRELPKQSLVEIDAIATRK